MADQTPRTYTDHPTMAFILLRIDTDDVAVKEAATALLDAIDADETRQSFVLADRKLQIDSTNPKGLSGVACGKGLSALPPDPDDPFEMEVLVTARSLNPNFAAGGRGSGLRSA